MNPRPVRSFLPLAAGFALTTLLVALAILQYRWIGQISDAERERLQASLRTGTFQFQREFSQELSRLCGVFTLRPFDLSPADWPRLAERYEEWAQTARRPELIAAIYLQEAQPPRLLQLDLKAHTWGPAPAGIVLPPLPSVTGEEPEARLFNWRLDDRATALVHPLVQFVRGPHEEERENQRFLGYLIVKLQRDVLATGFVPDLAQRTLPGPGQFAWQVLVARPGGEREILAHSPSAAALLEAPDAETDLLQGRPEGGPRPPGERGRPTPGGPPAPERWRRGDGFRGFGGGRPPQALATTGGERYLLVVKHSSGSLQAAVDRLRWRNLAVSSGVLLVLGISMGVLALSSRRAQKLARLQMEFVAGVSHELRTPLAVICSAADNLADGVVAARPQIVQYGSLIRDEGRRLTDMVNQILRFAAGESGKAHYALQPVSIAPALETALSNALAANGQPDVSIERHLPDSLPLVQADESALVQCLENLISNAIKYGGEARWIGLTAAVDQATLRLTVADHGLGIEPAELPQLFEPFFRGQAVRAAQIHGTGLGLQVAQQIARAFGGRITVESTPGLGSAFTLHLPALTSSAVETHALTHSAD